MSVRVGPGALHVAPAYAELCGRNTGAVVLFLGRVRPDRTGAGEVIALDYEAHRPMAETALRRIERRARRAHRLTGVVLWHRTGRLRVGTVSVIVGVGAPHRAAAYAASRELIEQLKVQVPIWKTPRGRPGRRRRALPRRRS